VPLQSRRIASGWCCLHAFAASNHSNLSCGFLGDCCWYCQNPRTHCSSNSSMNTNCWCSSSNAATRAKSGPCAACWDDHSLSKSCKTSTAIHYTIASNRRSRKPNSNNCTMEVPPACDLTQQLVGLEALVPLAPRRSTAHTSVVMGLVVAGEEESNWPTASAVYSCLV
jgi:hypothetical protein